MIMLFPYSRQTSISTGSIVVVENRLWSFVSTSGREDHGGREVF